MSTFIRAKLLHKYYARLPSNRIWPLLSFFSLRCATITNTMLTKSPSHKYLIILIYKRNMVWVLCAFKYTIRIQVLTSSTSLLLSLWTIAKSNRVQQVSLLVNNPAVISCSNKMKSEKQRRAPEIFTYRMEIHTIAYVCVCVCRVFLFGYFHCAWLMGGWVAGCIQHLNVTYGFQALRLNIFEFYYNLSFTHDGRGWQWKYRNIIKPIFRQMLHFVQLFIPQFTNRMNYIH